MKQIQLFAFLFFSLSSFAQGVGKMSFSDDHGSPTFTGVEIYGNIDSVKNKLLRDKSNTLVSYSDGVLIINSFIYNLSSDLIFKANPVSKNVFQFTRIMHPVKNGMTPMETYMYQVNQIRSGSQYKPYDQNVDPKYGDIYSKWLFSTGYLSVSLDHNGNVIVHSERVYEYDMSQYINGLKID